MATKQIKMCDKCLKNKKETNAIASISLFSGKYLDYDRYKDDYTEIDLCLEHLIQFTQDIVNKLPNEEQEKCLKALVFHN